MAKFFILIVARVSRFYLKGLALLAALLLWPVNALIWQRISEAGLIEPELNTSGRTLTPFSVDEILTGDPSEPSTSADAIDEPEFLTVHFCV